MSEENKIQENESLVESELLYCFTTSEKTIYSEFEPEVKGLQIYIKNAFTFDIAKKENYDIEVYYFNPEKIIDTEVLSLLGGNCNITQVDKSQLNWLNKTEKEANDELIESIFTHQKIYMDEQIRNNEILLNEKNEALMRIKELESHISQYEEHIQQLELQLSEIVNKRPEINYKKNRFER